ncbi:hypothetical protein C2845_PM05G36950 [Panicum miliaceum]|uniref:Uncharacterized protein n=1 Tax=Panicum miliaceum TaxID=4540 RepID=A0A3L6T6C2_PANMI|nr:hypothetical protein C2845_PM05G36950 [Panicum miliaceum]
MLSPSSVSTSSEALKAMVDGGKTVGWTEGAVVAVEAAPLGSEVAGGAPVHLAGDATEVGLGDDATSRSAGPRDEEALGPGDAATPPRMLGAPLPRARAQVLGAAGTAAAGRPSINPPVRDGTLDLGASIWLVGAWRAARLGRATGGVMRKGEGDQIGNQISQGKCVTGESGTEHDHAGTGVG